MDCLKGKMLGFVLKYKSYIKILENRIKELETEKRQNIGQLK